MQWEYLVASPQIGRENPLKPYATKSNWRESRESTSKLVSRNKTWSATAAPTPAKTADHASSMGFTRLHNSPETGHAARRSPKSSQIAPHPPQRRVASNSRNGMRRQRQIWNSSGRSVVAGDVHRSRREPCRSPRS